MNIFRRKKRHIKRAEAKAVKQKALAEAKFTAKNTRRLHKAQLRQQRKADAISHKSQDKLNKAHLATLKAQEKAAHRQGLTVASVKRYLGIIRVIAPIITPLIYRGATKFRAYLEERKARELGIPVEQLGEFSRPGATLSARIANAQESLDDIAKKHSGDKEASAFISATQDRLTDLRAAVRTSEQMPRNERKTVHQLISTQIHEIERQILDRLGL